MTSFEPAALNSRLKEGTFLQRTGLLLAAGVGTLASLVIIGLVVSGSFMRRCISLNFGAWLAGFALQMDLSVFGCPLHPTLHSDSFLPRSLSDDIASLLCRYVTVYTSTRPDK